MITFNFNSLLAGILASALRMRAEQIAGEDNTRGWTQLHIPQLSFAAEHYFGDITNQDRFQCFPLETNIPVIVDMNVHADRSKIYKPEPENLGCLQPFMKTMPYPALMFESSGPTPTLALSHNKFDYIFSLIDIGVWPLIEGQIQNDFKYHVSITTSESPDQFNSGWQSDGAPGYSTIEPEVGFSWLIRNMGTELSFFLGLSLAQENTTIDYRSVDAFKVGATMAYRLQLLGGSAGIGIDGYYLKQLTDDSVSFGRLDGLGMRGGGIGPVVFFVRNIGKDRLTFEAKLSPRVNIRKATIGSFFRVEFALIF